MTVSVASLYQSFKLLEAPWTEMDSQQVCALIKQTTKYSFELQNLRTSVFKLTGDTFFVFNTNYKLLLSCQDKR